MNNNKVVILEDYKNGKENTRITDEEMKQWLEEGYLLSGGGSFEDKYYAPIKTKGEQK